MPLKLATPRFYNANGTITRYAFGCGYVERYGPLSLYLEGTYHVRGIVGTERVWECFDTVGEARSFARMAFPYDPASDAFSGI